MEERSSLVGPVPRSRRSLVDRVRAAFAALPAHGVVTLVGPGGIGKSTIARAAAGPDAIVVALADADGLPGDLAGRASHATVVLDDADRVLDAIARFVATSSDDRRRAHAPRRLLVTSREPVGLADEVVIDVPPLAVDEAVAMLRPSAPDASDDDLRLLVERVECVPLAIALAGARLRLTGPRELAEKLDDRLRGLASDRRDLPPRHASMEACIAWSWERLDAPLQAALATVAAFEGPVTLEDFEAAIPDEDPIALADRLLARSLLRRTAPRGPAMLDLARHVRGFVRARALPTRHAEVVLGKLEAAAARVYGRSASAALDTLASLVPDALRAVATSTDSAVTARIVLALSDVLVVRHVIDARGDLARRAVAAADASGDPSLRVRLRVLAAKADLELGRPLDARTRLFEALAIADGPREIAEAKRSLGWASLALGDGDAATRAFDEAIAMTTDLGDVRGRADATAGRGLARCFLGMLADGHADLETAHALHVASGDALRRDKVADMARLTGLDLAAGDEPDLRASADAHRAGGRLWRSALDLVWLAHRSAGAERDALYDEARRAALEAGVRPDLAAALDPGAKEPSHAWRVGPDARWIERPAAAADGRIDLARHGSLRLVLEGLVAARLATPGRAISADGLLEAGWPGEKVRYDSGMLRVYTAIRRLRKLGLDELLVTRDDGYLLRPDVPLERSD